MKGGWVCVVLAVLMLGCAREETPCTVDEAQVFAALADRRITALSVSNTVMVAARIREICSGKMLSPKMFPYWANGTAMKIVPSLVAAERLDLMIASNGVDRTDASDAKVLERYNRILKKNCRTVSELATLFAPSTDAFLAQFGRESRQEAFFSRDVRFSVAERDVRQYYQQYSNAVANAENFNAAAMARATNACARLKAGEAWEAVAKEVTDDGRDENDQASVGYFEYWQDIQLKNAEVPEVAAAVARLKPGEWTDPIETAEGLVIARLNGTDPESGAYRCARILVQLAVTPQLIPSQELTGYLLKRKRQQFMYSIREDLVKDYPAVFPLGTNFTYKIWFESQKLRKGFNPL